MPGKNKPIKKKIYRGSGTEEYHARGALEREQDLEKVARWHRLGFSHREIVEKLDGKISISQVSGDLTLIRRRCLESMIEDRRIMALETLEAIRLVRKEAYLAWLRSQEDSQEIRDKQGTTDAGSYSEQQHTKKGQVGNPVFLQIIRETLKDERDLMGLDEAIKVDITTNGNSINWHELTTPTVIKVDPIEQMIQEERDKGRQMLESVGSAQSNEDEEGDGQE